MRYTLAYGKRGLQVELADDLNITAVEPLSAPAYEDQHQAVLDALEQPIESKGLHERVGATDTVAVVVNDITRHTPTPLLLSAIRTALAHVPPENIKILVATGTHRTNTPEELTEMLGTEWVNEFRIVQNDAEEPETHRKAGTTSSGNEVLFHKELLDCDLRIATGFIEPHLFAGFSGGGKAFMPGMAGLQTILRNHSPLNIDHPQARWGIIEDNPIWSEIQEASGFAEPAFLLNVTLDRDHHLTGVFAGDMKSAHRAGCRFVKAHSMVPVQEPFDIVITSNAGFPLDLNVYQSVKGMSAAAQVVRPGGAIIIAAECWDGIPEHGLYAQIMRSSSTPGALLDEISSADELRRDVWQAQIQASISMQADIYLYTDMLTEEAVRSVKLHPSASVEGTLERLLEEYGRDARICIMPEGPLFVPYLVS